MSAKTTHGKSKSPEYKSWQAMKYRCDKDTAKEYKYYGGRGIVYQETWKDFRKFYADMGDRPIGTTLDRIHVNGNYTADNCRWATAKTQCRNRRKNTMLTILGRTECISSWAELSGTPDTTIHSRLAYGWSNFESVYGKRVLIGGWYNDEGKGKLFSKEST